MSVGIYIPCYNVEKYITESLMSILNQNYQDWEVVVLDDCSTDNTYETALNMNDKRIKIIKKKEHSGLIGKIKNEAISLFTKEHDYVAHVGSDDYVPTYCLKLFVDFLEKHNNIGACCGNFLCFENASNNTWSFPHVANTNEFNPQTLLKYMCMFPMRFYRKSVVDKVGGYSNELSSAVDYDLALKISEITKIHRIKEPITYYYRQHPQQVSSQFRGQQDLNAKKALENALKRRNINGIVKNNTPPFIIEEKNNEQFIWGKK